MRLKNYTKRYQEESGFLKGCDGMGSTCTFTESILRNCGFRTGLFTSPHLIDIRERFRLDGVEICEEKFLAYFWWCYDRLKEKTDDSVPMPTFFHFLALLAFKIFSEEQVDVCIMEVGLGGKYDATNVVQAPIVYGITSLGYDHMEILGNTLGEIAGEKAGIFKHRIPAFTVTQPDEAMHVLKDKASQLNVPLQVTEPLDVKLLNGLKLGLEGEHQYVNAGLAVALCSTWMKINGHLEETHVKQIQHTLPEQFVKGLATASLQGRAQIVRDEHINNEISNELFFFLDGAHSPESMEACARWFSLAIKDHNLTLFSQKPDPSKFLNEVVKTRGGEAQKSAQVDLTGLSLYHKVGSHALTPTDSNIDLSWQFTLQKVWENLMQGNKGKNSGVASEDLTGMEMSVNNCEHSAVFSSLPLVINWLRDRVQIKELHQKETLVHQENFELHKKMDFIQKENAEEGL
ncbi:folylpolyglutamate synthase-like [Vicia villosa]|uniref:folylpolyglutamate synthase-like n=1 Tax=Vicia villosa TaxID=3911 RepID=UPI00273CF35A|nr:folylpolyglutamate synthase-like [Vicia villosa]